jgi:hypothetical protein
VNFDIGAVLTRAWQITWKNKVLWGITALPILPVFLLFPFWFVLVFMDGFDPNKIQSWAENPAFVILGVIFYLVIIVGSVALQIISRASVTLGVFKVETENQPVVFVDGLKNGLRYFLRIFGVFALISGGIFVVFLAFFACGALFSVATMGLGAICIQPLFLLMLPVSMLIMALMEQAEAAVVADELGIMDAVKRAYELIRSNIWRYVLITIVIYFGMNLIMSLIMFPLMLPFFFIMMNNLDSGMDFNNILKLQAVFGAVLFPVMALVQGFIMTYLKSAMMLVYLRLTRPVNEDKPELQAVVA